MFAHEFGDTIRPGFLHKMLGEEEAAEAPYKSYTETHGNPIFGIILVWDVSH